MVTGPLLSFPIPSAPSVPTGFLSLTVCPLLFLGLGPLLLVSLVPPRAWGPAAHGRLGTCGSPATFSRLPLSLLHRMAGDGDILLTSSEKDLHVALVSWKARTESNNDIRDKAEPRATTVWVGFTPAEKDKFLGLEQEQSGRRWSGLRGSPVCSAWGPASRCSLVTSSSPSKRVNTWNNPQVTRSVEVSFGGNRVQ